MRTFGDDELKEAFSKYKIENLPEMIKEVDHHIKIINEKAAFAKEDSTKLIINEAMMDITFSFRNLGSEELKIISGGEELKEKWNKAVRAFSENFDQEDPEYITLREAFMKRFKEHGFVVDSVDEFNEDTKNLDEILKKLNELKQRNNALLRKYHGDYKFARVHKRINEENKLRLAEHKEPLISEYDERVMMALLYIKDVIDDKVYDRNDILKKDAYFAKTVMVETKRGLDKLHLSNTREDREFIQKVSHVSI